MKKTLLLLFLAFNFNLFAQNQNISNGVVFDGEPYIAINPSNSNHMVVAWMGFQFQNSIVIKTRVSFDAGTSWSSTNWLPHAHPDFGSADPSIAFDNSGNVFVCYVDYDTGIDSGAVYVRKSTDGGLNWGNAVEVIEAHEDPGQYPLDRPWMSIDHSGGTYDGNIYITTMPPNVFGTLPPGYHPYVIRSVDGGNTFEPWKYLDTTGWLAGTQIQQPMPTHDVSSNGIFHAVYPSWETSQNLFPQYILASTSDGGLSYQHKTVVTLQGNTAFNDALAKKGYLLRTDPSDPNHLILLVLLANYGDADVFMLESFDDGVNWSGIMRVNDDPISNNRMQDLVWADFDTDGDLIVSWRDRRNGSDGTYSTSSEIWAAYRHKDSTNFSPNFVISDVLVPYDAILANSGNDFMCVDFENDTLNAVWGDTRDGYLNIWYSRMGIDGSVISVIELANENSNKLELYPNPAKNTVKIKNTDLLGDFDVYIFDLKGKEVYQEKNKSTIDISEFEAGTYIVKVKNGKRILTGKLLISK